jgi:hypothetical protein
MNGDWIDIASFTFFLGVAAFALTLFVRALRAWLKLPPPPKG